MKSSFVFLLANKAADISVSEHRLKCLLVAHRAVYGSLGNEKKIS